MAQQQLIETEGWSFFDWIQANTRAVTIGAALVVAGGAGYWFYTRSVDIKRLNAERGLNQAKQSMAAGNAALATTDLQRVASRYKGTPAGAQAAMLLAQYDFDQDKFDDGLKVLQPYQTSSAAGRNLGAIWSLTGDGLLSKAKVDEAVSAFRKAADATTYPGEKAVYLSKAARSLQMAGKNAEAKEIWERLKKDPEASLVHSEADIRLGELASQAAGKS
ncbi:MAG TPA: tetratricopeptide repeat protein [Vicinamibacterales bacterium]|nr:tetratricopeptide repeat protein [Vicinamibacterales bacterium]